MLQVLAPHCARSDLGRLLCTCHQLRAEGSCDGNSLWRGWSACAPPLVVCAALRSSIAYKKRGILCCMVDELHKTGCDMSSVIAQPCDAGCALFACALHVDDATTARELLALVHADDLFEALLMAIKQADVMTVHYILHDIVDALDAGQCEQLRAAAREPHCVDFGTLYSTVRIVQTHRMVLDAIFP